MTFAVEIFAVMIFAKCVQSNGERVFRAMVIFAG